MFRALLSPILVAAFFLQQPSASTSTQGQSISPVEPDRPDQTPTHIDKSVRPPVLIHSVEPHFTKEDRKTENGGSLQIYMWVDENGNPSHVRVVHGLNKKIDEEALAAVRQYKFKPAMRDGKPVKVDLYINVNVDFY